MTNYDKELFSCHKNKKLAARKYNIFICILMSILILLIFGMLYKLNNINLQNNIKYFNQNKQQLVNSTNLKQKQIDDYNIKLEKLKTKFQETNELLVLEGTIDASCIYDNSNVYTKDDNLSFLHKKFNELKIREIKVQTTYNFGFTYELSNINIIHTPGTNQSNLILSDHNLKLKYIEEHKEKTILTDSIHILAKKFSPQETNSIMYRTKLGALNSVQNNEEIRTKAMNSTKINIERLTEELGIKINVEIKMQGLCENNEVNINEIGYKEN